MEELQGNFTLNKIGYYTPALVEENSWLNDKQKPEDLAKFGKNYAVVFEGDAGTYLWTAKNAPEVGKKYWGHLQATSGKSIRFKTDKYEEPLTNSSSPQSPSQGSYEGHSDKEDSIARAVALKAAVEFCVGSGIQNEITVLDYADKYLAWLKNDSGTQGSGEGSITSPQASQVSQNPGSAVVQKRQWDKVGQNNTEPLPEEPEDLLGWINEGNEHDND